MNASQLNHRIPLENLRDHDLLLVEQEHGKEVPCVVPLLEELQSARFGTLPPAEQERLDQESAEMEGALGKVSVELSELKLEYDALQHSQEEEVRDLHTEVQRLQLENQRLTEKLVNANISA